MKRVYNSPHFTILDMMYIRDVMTNNNKYNTYCFCNINPNDSTHGMQIYQINILPLQPK